MPKKRLHKTKILPRRSCKKMKMSTNLRKNKDNIDYDESDCEIIDFSNESENTKEDLNENVETDCEVKTTKSINVIDNKKLNIKNLRKRKEKNSISNKNKVLKSECDLVSSLRSGRIRGDLPETKPHESNNKNSYIAEKILSTRTVNDSNQFLLKWKGVPDTENSWEPEETVEAKLITEYFTELEKNQISEQTTTNSFTTKNDLIINSNIISESIKQEDINEMKQKSNKRSRRRKKKLKATFKEVKTEDTEDLIKKTHYEEPIVVYNGDNKTKESNIIIEINKESELIKEVMNGKKQKNATENMKNSELIYLTNKTEEDDKMSEVELNFNEEKTGDIQCEETNHIVVKNVVEETIVVCNKENEFVIIVNDVIEIVEEKTIEPNLEIKENNRSQKCELIPTLIEKININSDETILNDSKEDIAICPKLHENNIIDNNDQPDDTARQMNIIESIDFEYKELNIGVNDIVPSNDIVHTEKIPTLVEKININSDEIILYDSKEDIKNCPKSSKNNIIDSNDQFDDSACKMNISEAIDSEYKELDVGVNDIVPNNNITDTEKIPTLVEKININSEETISYDSKDNIKNCPKFPKNNIIDSNDQSDDSARKMNISEAIDSEYKDDGVNDFEPNGDINDTDNIPTLVEKVNSNNDSKKNTSICSKSSENNIIDNNDDVTSKINDGEAIDSEYREQDDGVNDIETNDDIAGTEKNNDLKDDDAPENFPQNVQEIFQVEKILNMRVTKGKRYFFLKWEGFPDSENTWEPEANLECLEMIEEFVNKQRKLRTKKRKRVSEHFAKELIIESAKKPKRQSSYEPAPVMLETLPDDVKIKETCSIKPKGFPKSREAESILGSGVVNNELNFLIKWKDMDMANLVPARRANIECPQLVIKFYESNLTWQNPNGSISNTPDEKITVIQNIDCEPCLPIKPKKKKKCKVAPVAHEIHAKAISLSPTKIKIVRPHNKNNSIVTSSSSTVQAKKLTTTSSSTVQAKKLTTTSSSTVQAKKLTASASRMLNIIKNFQSNRKPTTATSESTQEENVLTCQYESRDLPPPISSPFSPPTSFPSTSYSTDYLPHSTVSALPQLHSLNDTPSAPNSTDYFPHPIAPSSLPPSFPPSFSSSIPSSLPSSLPSIPHLPPLRPVTSAADTHLPQTATYDSIDLTDTIDSPPLSHHQEMDIVTKPSTFNSKEIIEQQQQQMNIDIKYHLSTATNQSSPSLFQNNTQSINNQYPINHFINNLQIPIQTHANFQIPPQQNQSIINAHNQQYHSTNNQPNKSIKNAQRRKQHLLTNNQSNESIMSAQQHSIDRQLNQSSQQQQQQLNNQLNQSILKAQLQNNFNNNLLNQSITSAQFNQPIIQQSNSIDDKLDKSMQNIQQQHQQQLLQFMNNQQNQSILSSQQHQYNSFNNNQSIEKSLQLQDFNLLNQLQQQQQMTLIPQQFNHSINNQQNQSILNYQNPFGTITYHMNNNDFPQQQQQQTIIIPVNQNYYSPSQLPKMNSFSSQRLILPKAVSNGLSSSASSSMPNIQQIADSNNQLLRNSYLNLGGLL